MPIGTVLIASYSVITQRVVEHAGSLWLSTEIPNHGYAGEKLNSECVVGCLVGVWLAGVRRRTGREMVVLRVKGNEGEE